MTGREQKVYYSYSQISHKHSVPDDGLPPQAQPPPPPGKEARAPGFALPELEHNLQLLIELTEQEIIRNDRQLQYERDVVVNLTHELEKAAGALQQEQRAIASLSEVLALVEECERRLQPGCSDPLTLDECARVFQTLRDKYYEEYRMSDRVDLAVAIVYPLMKDYFKEWDPLKVSGQGRPLRSLSLGAARAPDGLEGEGPAGRSQPPSSSSGLHLRHRDHLPVEEPPGERPAAVARRAGPLCGRLPQVLLGAAEEPSWPSGGARPVWAPGTCGRCSGNLDSPTHSPSPRVR